MNWNNVDTGTISISDEENIKWKRRYKYVRDSIDDFGYMISRTRTKHVGKVYVSVCPFPTHNEKTGSFTIYPRGYEPDHGYGASQEYTSFYCFGCGEGGDVIKFKQLYEGLKDKKEACKLLEIENDIKINEDDIRQQMLKDELNTVQNSQLKTLDFSSINLICSNICRDYLNWVKENYPNSIQKEFSIIQKYYKNLDEQLLDLTMIEAKNLISETENIINQRKNILIK